MFLVGAYQEILGDMHNLLGDTHAVHVSLTNNGDEGEGARVEHIVKGDTVTEVLRYVEFDPEVLMGKLRRDVEMAVHANRMADQQAGRAAEVLRRGATGLYLPRRPERRLSAPVTSYKLQVQSDGSHEEHEWHEA